MVSHNLTSACESFICLVKKLPEIGVEVQFQVMRLIFFLGSVFKRVATNSYWQQ